MTVGDTRLNGGGGHQRNDLPSETFNTGGYPDAHSPCFSIQDVGAVTQGDVCLSGMMAWEGSTVILGVERKQNLEMSNKVAIETGCELTTIIQGRFKVPHVSELNEDETNTVVQGLFFPAMDTVSNNLHVTTSLTSEIALSEQYIAAVVFVLNSHPSRLLLGTLTRSWAAQCVDAGEALTSLPLRYPLRHLDFDSQVSALHYMSNQSALVALRSGDLHVVTMTAGKDESQEQQPLTFTSAPLQYTKTSSSLPVYKPAVAVSSTRVKGHSGHTRLVKADVFSSPKPDEMSTLVVSLLDVSSTGTVVGHMTHSLLVCVQSGDPGCVLDDPKVLSSGSTLALVGNTSRDNAACMAPRYAVHHREITIVQLGGDDVILREHDATAPSSWVLMSRFFLHRVRLCAAARLGVVSEDFHLSFRMIKHMIRESTYFPRLARVMLCSKTELLFCFTAPTTFQLCRFNWKTNAVSCLVSCTRETMTSIVSACKLDSPCGNASDVACFLEQIVLGPAGFRVEAITVPHCRTCPLEPFPWGTPDNLLSMSQEELKELWLTSGQRFDSRLYEFKSLSRVTETQFVDSQARQYTPAPVDSSSTVACYLNRIGAVLSYASHTREMNGIRQRFALYSDVLRRLHSASSRWPAFCDSELISSFPWTILRDGETRALFTTLRLWMLQSRVTFVSTVLLFDSLWRAPLWDSTTRDAAFQEVFSCVPPLSPLTDVAALLCQPSFEPFFSSEKNASAVLHILNQLLIAWSLEFREETTSVFLSVLRHLVTTAGSEQLRQLSQRLSLLGLQYDAYHRLLAASRTQQCSFLDFLTWSPTQRMHHVLVTLAATYIERVQQDGEVQLFELTSAKFAAIVHRVFLEPESDERVKSYSNVFLLATTLWNENDPTELGAESVLCFQTSLASETSYGTLSTTDCLTAWLWQILRHPGLTKKPHPAGDYITHSFAQAFHVEQTSLPTKDRRSSALTEPRDCFFRSWENDDTLTIQCSLSLLPVALVMTACPLIRPQAFVKLLASAFSDVSSVRKASVFGLLPGVIWSTAFLPDKTSSSTTLDPLCQCFQKLEAFQDMLRQEPSVQKTSTVFDTLDLQLMQDASSGSVEAGTQLLEKLLHQLPAQPVVGWATVFRWIQQARQTLFPGVCSDLIYGLLFCHVAALPAMPELELLIATWKTESSVAGYLEPAFFRRLGRAVLKAVRQLIFRSRYVKPSNLRAASKVCQLYPIQEATDLAARLSSSPSEAQSILNVVHDIQQTSSLITLCFLVDRLLSAAATLLCSEDGASGEGRGTVSSSSSSSVASSLPEDHDAHTALDLDKHPFLLKSDPSLLHFLRDVLPTSTTSTVDSGHDTSSCTSSGPSRRRSSKLHELESIETLPEDHETRFTLIRRRLSERYRFCSPLKLRGALRREQHFEIVNQFLKLCPALASDPYWAEVGELAATLNAKDLNDLDVRIKLARVCSLLVSRNVSEAVTVFADLSSALWTQHAAASSLSITTLCAVEGTRRVVILLALQWLHALHGMDGRDPQAPPLFAFHDSIIRLVSESLAGTFPCPTRSDVLLAAQLPLPQRLSELLKLERDLRRTAMMKDGTATSFWKTDRSDLEDARRYWEAYGEKAESSQQPTILRADMARKTLGLLSSAAAAVFAPAPTKVDPRELFPGLREPIEPRLPLEKTASFEAFMNPSPTYDTTATKPRSMHDLEFPPQDALKSQPESPVSSQPVGVKILRSSKKAKKGVPLPDDVFEVFDSWNQDS